jgi:hypothetical protein
MEACGGAHCLARLLRDQGHEVRLIPGQFVKRYREANKNDYLDAEAIAQAVTRKTLRFVPVQPLYIQLVPSLDKSSRAGLLVQWGITTINLFGSAWVKV